MLRTDTLETGARARDLTDFLSAGVVHDLGNLIQIASSALNIMARNPNIRASGLDPIIAGARTSLDQAGALVRQTIGLALAQEAALEEADLPVCFAEIEAM